MILEDPFVGLIAFVGLVALVTALRWLLPTRKVAALTPVLEGLRDVADDELQALARELHRLPKSAVQAPSVAPMLHALQDWRATFDEAERQRFLDLANTLLAEIKQTRSS